VDELLTVEIEENAYRADDFLREPFTAQTLMERIITLVGRGVSQSSIPPDITSVEGANVPQVEAVGAGLGGEGPTTDRGPAVKPDFPRSTGEILAVEERRSSPRTINMSSLEARIPPAESQKSSDLPVNRTLDLHGRPRVPQDADSSPSLPPASASPSPSPASKRATRRVPCNLSVSIKDGGGMIYKSETLNISNGGILISSDHPIEIGTHIDLVMEFPNSDKPITAVGKVAWVGRAQGGVDGTPAYGVGLKFSRIDPNDLQRIVDYVNRVSRVVYVAP
jgi:uncharacterized protein (TIGR02266 family)